jgi:hypothetical protein
VHASPTPRQSPALAERLRRRTRSWAEAARRDRWWLAVWLPLALWYAHPLWSARLLPLHDLPNHLARITALHYLGDPQWNVDAYYSRSLQLVPYLGHFYLVHLLAYPFRSVVLANLVFMSAYVIAAPLCGLSLARVTGRSPWLALFLLPLSVSFYFQWGFISFCAGVMLMLPALASLYQLLDEPSGRRALYLGLWTATLYLFHIVPWGTLGAYAIVLLAIELLSRRVRGPLLAAVAMAPSLGMMAIGLHQARSFGYVNQGSYLAQVDTPGRLMGRVLGMINLWQSTNVDEWILLGLMLLLLLLVVSDGGPSDEPWRVRVRVPLVFVVCLILAAETPFWIRRPFNWWMVNQRFFFPAACVAVFFPRGPIRGARLLLMAAAVALMLPLPQQLTRLYRDFSRRAAPLVELIQMTPLGANTLVLHTPGRVFEDPMLAPQMTIWRELYNYPLVYRGGYDPYMYDDGFPIKIKASLPAPKVPRAAELAFTPEQAKFNAATMMPAWDYFVVPDGDRDAMPVDGVVAVRSAGGWTLYRNVTRR